MAIPKVIYQTFKTNQIPWLTKLYIKRFRRKNKNYRYEFYDDQRVDAFIKESFDNEVYKAYSRLQIGAAKADFFRYAVLYVYGGVYLDLDSDILVNLDKYLQEHDDAVITREKNHQNLFAQWALVFEKGHPFLERTIKYIVENIQQNKYPNDVHSMTGPTVYTRAVNDVINEDPTVSYRIVPDDYKGIMKFKYKLGKLLIYGDRSQHWKKLQKVVTVVKSED
ncbi:glycosyltransferase family 32 protein [Sphingobacterium multivorum]|uniref:glycosyltransferase family 32 protein n=1 Tax=Sphingobacterium multivorum TaxID=28454 RepID=UPI000DFEDF16|nr:glycosyltransferase [Sphingobacterium multivorum]QQT42824.1 glycosyl transferase [Sphingobacterium multivorum]SUJ02186.1 Mannosyltransferase OCH1 and related enzymes [Sphingobacterium multivorum]HBI89921.1 glycosyl transferase [Sphingobacterium sp.]